MDTNYHEFLPACPDNFFKKVGSCRQAGRIATNFLSPDKIKMNSPHGVLSLHFSHGLKCKLTESENKDKLSARGRVPEMLNCFGNLTPDYLLKFLGELAHNGNLALTQYL